MEPSLLSVRRDGPVAHVRLGRPNVRNAFNAALIAELHRTFDDLAGDGTVRGVVLSGDGKTFCGGADVAWMRDSLTLPRNENLEDARAMSRMFRAIDRFPKPVVGRIHGAALGGGAGLVAVCDVAIASASTVFGFTETKLGILPAVISPFVLAKIGVSHARALALTGERFDAGRALAIGLVHEIVADESRLDAAVARVTDEIATASPTGIAATKRLFASVLAATYDESLDLTADAIATQRTSGEGQDGLRAFLEKRQPAWVT
ncbi:MAG: enoyl-CoA hydratase/isomerase family protein [Candidatus Eremiobacteraeota bacterium]|nr:enoyl-CoA hydratase/isomerase family protein [Candidatus Eremiobacteraeota bacterium]